MDATQIRPNLWISSAVPATNKDWLIANGITAVVNCAAEIDDPVIPEIQQIKVPLYDGPGNSQDGFAAAQAIVCKLLDAGETVLVHCFAGCSRAPYITAKVLSFRENRTYADIYYEIRVKRPAVLWPEILRPIYG